MKKYLLIGGLIAIVGIGIFVLSSCKKEEDEKCCCDGECVSMSEIKAEGYSSCAEAKADLCK